MADQIFYLTNINVLTIFRAKFVREVYTGMEQELHLIGVTGIEDRLQEQVVQTIQDLRVARIKVWIIITTITTTIPIIITITRSGC